MNILHTEKCKIYIFCHIQSSIALMLELPMLKVNFQQSGNEQTKQLGELYTLGSFSDIINCLTITF